MVWILVWIYKLLSEYTRNGVAFGMDFVVVEVLHKLNY